MGFGNIKIASGVESLNNFLEDKSYIDGYVPSQADVAIFEAMAGAPADKFAHAFRWYNHINSYKSQFESLPGIKKPIDQYGPASASAANGDASDDDDVDLFGSDSEEDEEAEKIRAERLVAYQERKSKKKVIIAKSNIILDVKPWDDETDMKELERLTRTVETDGLLWGASKLVAVGYGIQKLQISCVVEDDKVSTDFLEESITGFEDFVQSVDIAAFNKV
ncbi:unnamed protein product [Clavelina lepadiformis]|uniref:Elongation factor 1-beta n=1 Tax=Clavelina lepadiformis TaxID=159417 RepID=A0ABP0GVW7_CLALP